MHSLTALFVLLAAGLAQQINAHTTFTNFFVDSVNQGDGVAVRMSNNNAQATFPIPNVTSPDMACGVNGEHGVSRIAPVKAGSTLVFEWRSSPDGSRSGSIDISHKGPCAVYMKKVDNSVASNNAAGPGWFKIMEEGYDSEAGKWCTEKLIPNDGHLAAKVPKDLAAGYYLVRPELLALHAAASTPPDPQFYVGCAQIFIPSGGSANPPNTVSIPGYVNLSTPAMTYNIWQKPLKLPFPDFGPQVYGGGNSKREVIARDMTQTFGLKPEGCVMTNGDWCGFMPPKSTDQNSCWNSAKNCWNQTDACYKSAGPTGSKNCKNWENYCHSMNDACSSGSYNGPPSPSKFIPAPLKKLDPSKVVTGAGPMQSSSVASESSTSVSSVHSSTPTSTSSATDQSMENGSISTCGSNGGQNCKTGMCCSAQG
ncbi:hypothetical protein ACLMJK_003610 [Lecanora helva]